MTRERKGKRKKSVSIVTEVPDCQGEKGTDKEEYVRLLNEIKVDVKRLWEGLLFYTAYKQLGEYYFSQVEINPFVHGSSVLSPCIGKGRVVQFSATPGGESC